MPETLLQGCTSGIVLNGPPRDRGPVVRPAPCRMDLEGIVSRRRHAAYRSAGVHGGKNPDSPAAGRVLEES